ncbi:MAG: hypothetical protein OHK0040_11340 [bacterium]
MKSKENKKIAAAITAINMLLEEERLLEAIKPFQTETTAKAYDFTPPKKEDMLKEISGSSTAWSQAGRVQSMNIRTLWQLKLYK